VTRVLPRYPVYVPSKGRVSTPHTMRMLSESDVPFRVVVEAEERDAYAAVAGDDRLLVLPESGQGLIFARNWIMAHAIAEGHARHWQLDDNIENVRRVVRGHRIPADAGPALRCVEDFVDRYTNVAIAGLNYSFFWDKGKTPPFWRNVHVYSCTLVNNAIPHRWRLRYNDDTDMCLQVLADGWCTVLVNAYLVRKMQTMTIKGGNTDDLYRGDGRLVMARELERMWPGVVETTRRFGRPQHRIKHTWRRFDTPLILRDDVDLSKLPAVDEYGVELRQVADAVESPAMRELLEEGLG
jgi:hypothetical protein